MADKISDIERIRRKYPDRVPVFINKDQSCTLPMITKTKFLTPQDISVAQFVYVIRRWIKLKPEEAIFLYIDNTIPSSNLTMGELYHKYKNAEGALNMTYSSENTFG